MSNPIFTNVKVGDQVLITTGYRPGPMTLTIGRVIRVAKLSFRVKSPGEAFDITFNVSGRSINDIYIRRAEPLTEEAQARYDAWPGTEPPHA